MTVLVVGGWYGLRCLTVCPTIWTALCSPDAMATGPSLQDWDAHPLLPQLHSSQTVALSRKECLSLSWSFHLQGSLLLALAPVSYLDMDVWIGTTRAPDLLWEVCDTVNSSSPHSASLGSQHCSWMYPSELTAGKSSFHCLITEASRPRQHITHYT